MSRFCIITIFITALLFVGVGANRNIPIAANFTGKFPVALYPESTSMAMKNVSGQLNMSLPICNIIASCSSLPDPYCTYTLPPNCMLQYAFASSSKYFGFDIRSSNQAKLYIDFGPDPLHVFGSCCSSSSGRSSCYVENVYEWSYRSSCPTSCATFTAVMNLGSVATNVAVYGQKPM